MAESVNPADISQQEKELDKQIEDLNLQLKNEDNKIEKMKFAIAKEKAKLLSSQASESKKNRLRNRIDKLNTTTENQLQLMNKCVIKPSVALFDFVDNFIKTERKNTEEYRAHVGAVVKEKDSILKTAVEEYQEMKASHSEILSKLMGDVSKMKETVRAAKEESIRIEEENAILQNEIQLQRNLALEYLANISRTKEDINEINEELENKETAFNQEKQSLLHELEICQKSTEETKAR